MKENTHNCPHAEMNKNVFRTEYPFSYTHDGYTYGLPCPRPDKGLKYESLELTFCTAKHDARRVVLNTDMEDREFAALDVNGHYDIHLSLCGEHVMGPAVNPTPVTAYVYRKKRRKPLYKVELEQTASDYNGNLSDVQLRPGDYFVLIDGITANYTCQFDIEELGGMDTYHFSILEHGSRLEHPTLVCRQIEELPLLQLKPSKGQLKEYDIYHLNCYNSAYRKVYTRRCNVSENAMTISLMDLAWPVDDHYTLVLYHNNQPFMVYTYTLLDRKICHLRDTYLPAFGPVYTLATTIEHQEGSDRFTGEPGFSPVKEYVLNVLSGDLSAGNLMVVCEMQPSEEFVMSIMELLHCTSSVGVVDAEKLVWEWERCGKNCMNILTEYYAVHIRNAGLLLKARHQPLLEALDEHIQKDLQTVYFFEKVGTIESLLGRLTCTETHFEPRRRLIVMDYEGPDVAYIVNGMLSVNANCRMDPRSLKALSDLVMNKEDVFAPMDRQALNRWTLDTILPYVGKEYGMELEDHLNEMLEVLIDFSKIPLPGNPVDVMEDCMKELNDMVGLDTLKARLKSLFNRVKFDNMRLEQGLPSLGENRHHMIFTGNPGTGKTTVARIMGKIFKQLGVLSNGEVITAERADMVGKYVGHTEDQMKDLLEKARGNVLFIDEAYSLCDNNGPDRSDFGHRAIECLLGVLANPDSDMIIIMAGYEKQMKQLLDMNPGLRGRFTHTFNFEDYDAEQLLEISINKLYGKQFSLDDSVKVAMKECICRALEAKDEQFHNARWAEQFVMQGILTAMADRLCTENRPLTYEELRTVTVEDVKTGYTQTVPASKQVRNQVGFR